MAATTTHTSSVILAWGESRGANGEVVGAPAAVLLASQRRGYREIHVEILYVTHAAEGQMSDRIGSGNVKRDRRAGDALEFDGGRADLTPAEIEVAVKATWSHGHGWRTLATGDTYWDGRQRVTV